MTDSIEVVIRQPGFPDRVIPLQEGRMRLGRADDNEIVLSDVGVSRRHAQIVVQGGQVSIEDLGSGNGTYYYGHRVKSQLMRDQDEIVIDPFVLQFQIKGAGGIAPPALLDPAADNAPRLEVVVGNGIQGNRFPIVDGSLTLGRAEDRDVVVPDAASSRHHCHITLDNGEYVLHDNGSANGVFVNAVRVRECTLSNGDLIRIGNTELRFVNPAASQAPTQDLGDASSWGAHEPLAGPGHIPIEPSDNPVSTVLRNAPTARELGEDDDDLPAAPANRKMLAAVAGAVVFVGGATLVVVAALVVVVLWATTERVAVVDIPARPPTWELRLPALPESSSDELIQQGTRAAEQGDFPKTLESLYRVLLSKPSDPTAMLFSDFAGEQMVLAVMEAELRDRVADEERRVRRRDRLLRDLESRVYRRQRDARSELTQDYRDDPVVIAYTEENKAAMGAAWGLSTEQINLRRDRDRLEREVQTDAFEDAIRTGRKLLADPKLKDAALREDVRGLLTTAERQTAAKVAPTWRKALVDEALPERRADAIRGFKVVLTESESNVSAALHLARLEPR